MIRSVQNGRGRGLSLAEVMVALGLITFMILALAGLSFSTLSSSQKSGDVALATQVAHQQLKRSVETARADPNFWAADHLAAPWTTGTVTVGSTEFRFEVFAQTLVDSVAGTELGGDPANSNRVKKVDIVVSWMSSGPRVGYGKLSTHASCLVNE